MLLKLRLLKKEYKREKTTFRAVDDVNLSIDEGELVCITGRSGSGKSTLLCMIAGLLEPTSGDIIFDDVELSRLKDSERSFLRNTRIGYIPQGQSILSNFSVLHNVALPFYLFKREGDPTTRARRLLEQVGISHLENSYPARLSGGEMRRIAIARSLINNPRLLIADEPTGDLDPQTTDEVMKLFGYITKNGVSIILVTHDVGVIHYSSKHFYMDSGHLTKN
jgi:putative ABC transport system ATP-binding protein